MKMTMLKEKNNPIASVVRRERRKMQMSQQELADQSGSSLKFIRQLEQGKLTVRLDKVNELLSYFGRYCSASKKRK